mmetsp:Transcript_50859/g.75366  ORF Transcript_50859/g.75366 Transcript_50859/m.75366 type:complete len:234 (-) Transcript_50859:224-925(-)
MTAQSFWEAAQDLITVTERHPFLVAMVNGTLPLDNFQYYVVQDAIYLADFAECYRILSRNVGISEADSKRLMEFANGAQEEAKGLHETFFTKWGIDAKDVKAMPNTLLYTSHMLRIVATRDHAEGLSIMLPCMWVYMHVGKCMLKLRDELGDSVKRCEQFDAWIDMYASEEFEKEVREYIDMVDVAAKNATPEKLELMKEHFLMSCKLEHMFWDQALALLEWPKISNVGNDDE